MTNVPERPRLVHQPLPRFPNCSCSKRPWVPLPDPLKAVLLIEEPTPARHLGAWRTRRCWRGPIAATPRILLLFLLLRFPNPLGPFEDLLPLSWLGVQASATINIFEALLPKLHRVLLHPGRPLWPPLVFSQILSTSFLLLSPPCCLLVLLVNFLGLLLQLSQLSQLVLNRPWALRHGSFQVRRPWHLPELNLLIRAAMNQKRVREEPSALIRADMHTHLSSRCAWEHSQKLVIFGSCYFHIHIHLPVLHPCSSKAARQADQPSIVTGILQADRAQALKSLNCQWVQGLCFCRLLFILKAPLASSRPPPEGPCSSRPPHASWSRFGRHGLPYRRLLLLNLSCLALLTCPLFSPWCHRGWSLLGKTPIHPLPGGG